jgi:protein-S-isoprenylcysteine O-methyltransferase Ste14
LFVLWVAALPDASVGMCCTEALAKRQKNAELAATTQKAFLCVGYVCEQKPKPCLWVSPVRLCSFVAVLFSIAGLCLLLWMIRNASSITSF